MSSSALAESTFNPWRALSARAVNFATGNFWRMVRQVVFYAAQEAIRNAARHGRGGDAQRRLSLAVIMRRNAGLQIVIDDDGVGRNGAQANGESGNGLRFHSAMLAIIGGTLSVEDRSGGGTQVVIEAPEN